MFRPASRVISFRGLPAFRARTSKHFLSTAPPHLKSRSWKSSAARWGIAVAGIYYYNTSTLFAEQPNQALRDSQLQQEDESLTTLASLSPSKRFQPPSPAIDPTAPLTPSASSPPSIDPKAPSPALPELPLEPQPQDVEDDEPSQGAYNEETGEINWDCPCLGGMAHGPCGEDFRAAFSCFVFSKEEPKGIDCIERFKGMQNCFREHPDVYGAELEDDDEMGGEEEGRQEALGQGADLAGSPPEDEAVAAVASIRHSDAATSPNGQPSGMLPLPDSSLSNTRSEDKETEAGHGKTLIQVSADKKPESNPLVKLTHEKNATQEDWPEDVVPKAAHDAHDATSRPE